MATAVGPLVVGWEDLAVALPDATLQPLGDTEVILACRHVSCDHY